MDWKRFYADELADPRGRAAAEAALERHRGGDGRIEAALLAGGTVSFPHVSIHDSADPIARVVETILHMKVPRVVALGVLHAGGLPADDRRQHAAMQRDTPEGAEAFRRLGGAFVARGPAETPFGRIEEGPCPTFSTLLREGTDILRHEFSLDLFLALLAASGRGRGVRPPAVTRIFVSATRDPSGGFESAPTLAHAIDELVDNETVCVATGDIAHVGHGYNAPVEAAGLPIDADTLTATIVPQIRDMHDAALARRDFAAAWEIGTRLMSDQRHILPVMAGRLGRGARHEQLDFRLSDYSGINGRPAPCFVASALNVFTPGIRTPSQ